MRTVANEELRLFFEEMNKNVEEIRENVENYLVNKEYLNNIDGEVKINYV